MKIVILERNSVGTDVSVDSISEYGETTVYRNTTAEDVAERIKDAQIIVANKVPLNESTLKDAKDVKLICEFATGYDNVDLNYCKSRGIKVANGKLLHGCRGTAHVCNVSLYPGKAPPL